VFQVPRAKLKIDFWRGRRLQDARQTLPGRRSEHESRDAVRGDRNSRSRALRRPPRGSGMSSFVTSWISCSG